MNELVIELKEMKDRLEDCIARVKAGEALDETQEAFLTSIGAL